MARIVTLDEDLEQSGTIENYHEVRVNDRPSEIGRENFISPEEGKELEITQNKEVLENKKDSEIKEKAVDETNLHLKQKSLIK